jgi:hypothetical protein
VGERWKEGKQGREKEHREKEGDRERRKGSVEFYLFRFYISTQDIFAKIHIFLNNYILCCIIILKLNNFHYSDIYIEGFYFVSTIGRK